MSGDELVPISAPFWAAAAEHRLDLQRCPTCDRFVWYPRAACPGCLGDDLEWQTVAGAGVVYAVSVHRHAARPELEAPYAVALVELDEGVRLLSRIVNCPADAVSVGDRVRATWEDGEDGRSLLLFEPAT